MKITTEKLPRSLLALDIELEPDQVEKGLDRAARRLSQKYTIPGFRKGKAPRFIVENYFGRAALMEEASEDLINKSFREAIKQEQINPVGPPNLDSFDSSGAFRFRVTIPVEPSVELSDYRSIRLPLEIEPVTDEMVERNLNARRDKHAVLRELDEPRPAQPQDQLTVKMETFVDGEPLEEHPEDQEAPDTTLVLDSERLIGDLYEGLLGATIDETREIAAQMPEDHPNEQVRDKEVTFKVRVVGIQERILPEWDELPVLEEVEGSLDDLRTQTRENLETSMRDNAEQQLIDAFIQQVVEQTSYDVPDAMIEEVAGELLEQQGQQFARYGIALDQMLQYQGQTREQAIEELLPTAEERLKTRLALQQIVRNESLDITQEEVEAEATNILDDLDETTTQALMEKPELSGQFLNTVANSVLDRKLRARLIAIATGEAPELATSADSDESPAGETTETTETAETPEAETATTAEAATGGETARTPQEGGAEPDVRTTP